MNKARRVEIASNTRELEQLKSDLETIKYNFESILFDEQDSYDNIPENLQNSDRAIISEEAIDKLGDTVDFMESAIDDLNDAINSIKEI